MIFDKQQILAGIKNGLTVNEKKDSVRIENALNLGLNDLSARLVADGALTTYDVSLNAGDVEVTLKGDNLDLVNIYAIKIVDASGDVSILEWLDRDKYLRDIATDTNRASGLPKYFTQLSNSEGFPIITLDRTMASSGTMTVFFVPEITSDTAHKFRAGAACVNVGLAYFFGADTNEGRGYYQLYLDLVPKFRGKDRYIQQDTKSRFEMSKFDREVRALLNEKRVRR